MTDAVASQRIAAALREEILGGRYRPGERIRQEELAARSGASRIPVREALRMLEADGLVTVVANSGARVTRLTAQELSETYQVRERLEPLLLAMSLPALPGQAVTRMGELAAAMEAAASAATGPDVDAFLRADREFHLSGYAGAAGGEAWRIVSRMWNTTQHYRREFTRLAAARAGSGPAGSGPAGLGVTHLEHRLLLDCIRRRDPDDAERALVTHIRRTRLALLEHPEIFA
ncbi:MAG TPA: GntR family transcriptional regulator [Trebonia sp.]|nr:GntR family transcriptional regulator [Trebonia sp.]